MTLMGIWPHPHLRKALRKSLVFSWDFPGSANYWTGLSRFHVLKSGRYAPVNWSEGYINKWKQTCVSNFVFLHFGDSGGAHDLVFCTAIWNVTGFSSFIQWPNVSLMLIFTVYNHVQLSSQCRSALFMDERARSRCQNTQKNLSVISLSCWLKRDDIDLKLMPDLAAAFSILLILFFFFVKLRECFLPEGNMEYW